MSFPSFPHRGPKHFTGKVAGFTQPLPDIHRKTGSEADRSAKCYEDNKHRVQSISLVSIKVPLRRNAFLKPTTRELMTKEEITKAKASGVFEQRSYQGPVHATSKTLLPPFPGPRTILGRMTGFKGTLYTT